LLWWHARATTKPARQIQAALFLLAGVMAFRVFVAILEIRGIHAREAIRVIGAAVLEGAELAAWILLAAAFLAKAADAVHEVRASSVHAPRSLDPVERAPGP
jgi:hypothetical protein